MSDSVRPHRRQPTRLRRPWDSPGKNTGVGCHFLLQCVKVKNESEVSQSCPTLRDPMDCSLAAPPSMGFSRQEYWNGVLFCLTPLQICADKSLVFLKPFPENVIPPHCSSCNTDPVRLMVVALLTIFQVIIHL